MRRRKKIKAPVPVEAPPPRGGWKSEDSVIRFAGRFVLLTLCFYALLPLPFLERGLSAYAEMSAHIANACLHVLGQPTRAFSGTITSDKFAVTVLRECTGTDFTLFFLAAILAFPTQLAHKVAGLVLGLPILAGLNLLRIVSVFLVGVYRPQQFDTIHEELWPGLFIFGTLAVATAWVVWVKRTQDVGGASRNAALFLGRFGLGFGLFLMPWPGLADGCGTYFRTVVRWTMSSESGVRGVEFEAQEGHGTRVVIINRALMSPDGSGPVRHLDLNTMAIVWRPFALFASLVCATPVPWPRRARTFFFGGICVQAFLLLTVGFVIWNDSSEIGLTTFTPLGKAIANDMALDLVYQLNLALPVLVWLLGIVRKEAGGGTMGSTPTLIQAIDRSSLLRAELPNTRRVGGKPKEKMIFLGPVNARLQ